ncbi:S41 family peptidase [Aurantiacibacter sp. MUD61]|uniref:S41 family peptidase n=1 Tax=Aurantiacibacter sp. MUD61 TaxID=3009083 RepID=UPI0022F0AFC7|nr:S41 family peptidase [Aurantiacibacter sp. MUD61]
MIFHNNNPNKTSKRTVSAAALLATAAAMALAGCVAGNTAARAEAQQTTAASAQDERAARSEVLAQLADRLETGYLFPQWGAAYAAYLRERGISEADAALSAEDFASLITDELQEVYPDGHLRLEVMEEGEDEHPHGPPPPSNFAAHHADGVSYMRIDLLFGLEETMVLLEDFVTAAAPGKAIIIDLRENRGGGLREMDFLFAEMFAEPTDLVVMEIREIIFENDGAPFGGATSLHRIDAPEGLVHHMHRTAPASPPRLADHAIYVLTSNITGSAGEHITMALQRTGRAMIVGEATRGAAHFGGMLPVGHGFAAFVPAGRTFNPDTGESWEGTGNQPDIATAADQALRRALAEAGLGDAAMQEFVAAIDAAPGP